MRALPEAPAFLTVGARTVATDQHGYLLNPDDWDETVALSLAKDAGVELTELHWRVIRFMRAYLAEHGIATDARHVFRFLNESTKDGKSGRALFFELFPYGYVGHACKIAGMRQPRAWSTG